MYLILFILFWVLGLITYFMFFSNKVLACLVLFCFLMFLDVMGVIYFLSYVTSPLFVNDSSDFILLIVLSFLQSGLVMFYSFLGKYFLSYGFIYPICEKKVNLSLDKVAVGLDSVYLDEELEEGLVKSYVIEYSFTPSKVLCNTSCLGSGKGLINFFYGGMACFKDFFLALECIFLFYYKANNNTKLYVFDYSFFIYKQLVDIFGGSFMSYDDFLSVFILYVDQVFYNCFVNSGIYFLKAEFDLDVKFWLDKLDSNGNFLDSFLQSFSDSPYIYGKSSFNFSLEEYDFNNPYHLSSTLVPYSTLFSDFNHIKKDSMSYSYSAIRFATSNSTHLSNISGMSDKEWSTFVSKGKQGPEFKVFLSHCSKF